ncbi:T9SS type B sorting domain-containing protein [Flavobacterium sp. GT3P67]|uniref:T9SS type B sorting domain-containing protein n=1 Tax=Flavobacterium sp. GT3P67 TaxID=2541722 RepID=UPI0010455019|nr:choice-of-anchor L domain-containing protein [Flavobacterium sp. GT3P67]TDE51035.1 T9SS type B sorting domain-containing protein [Flavobacterium sp. GT3P67]
MKCVKIILFYIFICCVIFDATAQSISVNDSYTAQQLVENILVNSSCANVSNFIAKGDSFSGSQNSYAYFNNQGSSFPFTQGVLLSTRSSQNSRGPFVRNLGGGNPSWLGDTDLEQALGITNTINATVLEFDFTALTDFISFDYIFASNEYQDDFPCNYSDGFAFLIKEINTTAYTNLALLPGTSTPVSSKSIHPLINPIPNSTEPIKSCGPENEFYFGGFNTATSPINYAGQTKVLTAQTKVQPGRTYHIKLVIADQRNQYYDSAVFIEAGSFLPKIDLGSDRLLATNNPICFGESFNIDTKLPASLGYTYKWFKNNLEFTNNASTYSVTGPGIYRVEVQLTPSCIATEEIIIEYTPEIDLNDTTLSQCDIDNDGISIFNLTKVDAVIKNNVSNLSAVVYYETLVDAQAKTNPITNPTTYSNKFINQSVFSRVSNSFNCVNYAEVKLIISNNAIAVQNPISTCDTDGTNDGLAQFDLNTQVTPQVVTGLPAGLIVEYYLNPTDAIVQQNQLSNIFKNTIATQQIIYARIVNGSDCYAITPITLVVNNFDPPNFQEENAVLCNGTSINLTVDTGFSSYLWSTGAISNSISISTSGDYWVKVTSANGCEKTKKYHVTASGIATITGAIINDFSGNENSVLIEHTGIGDYEFSIDGSFFQDNPMFDRIAPGEYLVYARDKNGCGLSIPFVVYVLDYPRYFTPNGDGYNDIWQIKNLDNLPQSTLHIFDRYGKFLKQLITSDIGWNGTFNGFALPTDDYWFHLNLENGRVIKGHFSLKR